jgi:hypothetical protein
MTIYYVDPVNGNDGAAGTSFATRKRTLTSATAAATPTEVRVIKSPDPTVLGTCSFTDGGSTITIPSGTIADIDMCEAGWTSVSGLNTLTYSTTKRQGTYSLSIAIGATFTTGKILYKSFASTDLSAFKRISFWLRQTAGTLASNNDITINLCSDTTGDVVVNSFNLNSVGTLNKWCAYTLDPTLTGALGSAIQSISIVLNVDRGAQTFQFDNIIAVRGADEANSLNLRSLIGKNTGNEPWVAIAALSGTTATICSNPEFATYGVYCGATETVTAYKREPLQAPKGALLTFGNISKACNISGGWNDTDMSTQTGETYLDGQESTLHGLYLSWSGTSATSYYEKMNFVRFANIIYFGAAAGSTMSIDVNFSDITACTAPFGFSGTPGIRVNAVIQNMSNCAGNLLAISGAEATISGANIFGSGSNGLIYLSGSHNTNITYANAKWCSGNGITINSSTNTNVTITSDVYGTGNTGIQMDRCDGVKMKVGGSLNGFTTGFTAIGCTDSVYDFRGATINATSYSHNASTGTSVTGLKVIGGTFNKVFGSFGRGKNVFIAPTFGAGVSITSGMVTSMNGAVVSIQDYNGVASDHRTYSYSGSILPVTSPVHSSGVAWSLSPVAARAEGYPRAVTMKIGEFAVDASGSVSVNVWVNRSAADSTAQLRAEDPTGLVLSGTITSTITTTTPDTWEQKTITFTPTLPGIVRVFIDAWGSTTTYVDDVTVA